MPTGRLCASLHATAQVLQPEHFDTSTKNPSCVIFFLLGLTDFYKVGVLRIAFGQRARAQRGKRIDVAAYVDDITVLVDRRVPSALRNAHNARHNS